MEKVLRTIVKPTAEGFEIQTAEYNNRSGLKINKVYHGGGLYAVNFVHNEDDKKEFTALLTIAKRKARDIVKGQIEPLRCILKATK